MEQTSKARLAAFLVAAKRRTYAGLDDDATVSSPVFAGSRQLEYGEHDLSYRDIYFGMAFFVGQETVTANARVIWSMSYSGGVSPDITDRGRSLAIYAFLRQALLGVGDIRPFRGPPQFEQGDFRYMNSSEGDLSEFRGTEHIDHGATRVYALRYGGGILR